MVRFFAIIACFVAAAVTKRPKIKDHNGFALIDLASIGYNCADSFTGYAIVDGSLEKCDNFTAVQKGQQVPFEYEVYKCRHLRAHGVMKNEKCVCREKYKGPMCNDYIECPSDEPSLRNFKCSKSSCAHDGIMAIGSNHLECICKAHWDGRFCERMACWRLTVRGQDRRYKNGMDGCECGPHYEGADCSVLKSCEKDGKLKGGACVCNEGYGGETCERKCPYGHVTCSSFSSLLSLPVMATIILLLH